MESLRRRREHMVEAHLVARGIADAQVLRAFRNVAREAFLPADAHTAEVLEARSRTDSSS